MTSQPRIEEPKIYGPSEDQSRTPVPSRRRWRATNVPIPEAHLLGVAVALALRRLRPAVLPGRSAAHRVVGSILIVAATVLIARSMRAAGRVELEHPGRLVTSGPYAVSRNPMYLGWTLLHLGVGVVARSGWTILTAAAAVVWIHADILGEERSLSALFGDEFVDYREAVPRYLPRGRWRTCWAIS